MPLTLTPHLTNLSNLNNDFSVQVPGVGGGSKNIYNIGGVIYFVNKRQVPYPNVPFGPPNDFTIWKSTDGGLTWVHVVQSVISNNENCATCTDGTKIFVSDYAQFGPPFPAKIWSYDPATNIFAGPSSDGPNEDFTDQAQTCSCNNAGIIITVFTDPTGILKSVQYNPVGDSWTIPITINAGPAFPVAQISEPILNRVFVFWYNAANQLFCSTLDSTGAVLNTTGVLETFTGTPTSQQAIGVPIISTGSPSGNPSVLLPYKKGGPPQLKAVWIDTTNNAVTNETVDNASTLPPGDQIQAYSLTSTPGWNSFDFGGVAYVAYAVDNGDNNDSTSQSFLYIRSRVAGVWGNTQVAFTSVVPQEMALPYVTTYLGQPAVLVVLFDPTLGPNNVDSLSAWILSASSTPPPPPVNRPAAILINVGGTNSGPPSSQGPIALPDPMLRCNVDGRKRCVTYPKGFRQK